jgi:hypothetical protein
MSVPPTHASNTVIILISVDVNAIGVPTYTPYFLFSGDPAPDPVLVKPGDRVGWYVRIVSKTLPQTLPYELTFADTTMFGTASLSVPQGGGSPYLLVLPTINGLKTKYSLRVAGIQQVYDPEMQTDTSGGRPPAKREVKGVRVSDYVISWPDTSQKTLKCTKNGSAQAFPVPASPGDSIQFSVTGSAAPPAFQVKFDDTASFWLSPFGPADTYYSTASNGNTSSTDALPVGNVKPPNKAFTFHLDTGDAQSNNYVITVT